MSGMPLVRVYSACPPEEKIRRLKLVFEWGRMDLEEFERRVEEALLEEQELDQRRIPRLSR